MPGVGRADSQTRTGMFVVDGLKRGPVSADCAIRKEKKRPIRLDGAIGFQRVISPNLQK